MRAFSAACVVLVAVSAGYGQVNEFFAMSYDQQVAERDRWLQMPDGADRIVACLSDDKGYSASDAQMVLCNGLVKLGERASPAVLSTLQKPGARFGYWMNRWAASLTHEESSRVGRLLAADPRILSTQVGGLNGGYLLRDGCGAIEAAIENGERWPLEKQQALLQVVTANHRAVGLAKKLLESSDRPSQEAALRYFGSLAKPQLELEALLTRVMDREMLTTAEGQTQVLGNFGVATRAYAAHASDPAAAAEKLRVLAGRPACAPWLAEAFATLGQRGAPVTQALLDLVSVSEDSYIGYNRAFAVIKQIEPRWEEVVVASLAKLAPRDRPALRTVVVEIKTGERRTRAIKLLGESLGEAADDLVFCELAALVLREEAALDDAAETAAVARIDRLFSQRFAGVDRLLDAFTDVGPPAQLVPVFERLITSHDPWWEHRATLVLAGSAQAAESVAKALKKAIAAAPTATPLSETEAAVFAACDLAWRYLYRVRVRPESVAGLFEDAARLTLLTETRARDEGLRNLRHQVANRCLADKEFCERTLQTCRSHPDGMAKLLGSYLEGVPGGGTCIAAPLEDYRAALTSKWLSDVGGKEVRERLYVAMVRCGYADPEAVAFVSGQMGTQRVNGADVDTSAFAAMLARLSPRPEGFDLKVVRMIADERPRMRRMGLAAAAEVPSLSATVVPQLAALLEDREAVAERPLVIRALVASARDSRAAIDALERAAVSSDQHISRAATEALRKLDPARE